MAEPEHPHQGEQANIRTMKSDISEFLKDTKPSLIQMITAEEPRRIAEEIEEDERPKRRPAGLIALIGVLMLLLGAGGFFAYRLLRPATTQEATLKIPQPLFSVEKSSTVRITSRESATPYEKSLNRGDVSDRSGSITRIIPLFSEDSAATRALSAVEFLAAADIRLPSKAVSRLEGSYMPILFRLGQSWRQGLILKISDRQRVFEALLEEEPSMAQHWASLFPNRLPPTRIVPFEDREYRNVGYRILPLDPSSDVQLAYGFFSAKNYLIVTDSEEAFRAVINRLFQAS